MYENESLSVDLKLTQHCKSLYLKKKLKSRILILKIYLRKITNNNHQQQNLFYCYLNSKRVETHKCQVSKNQWHKFIYGVFIQQSKIVFISIYEIEGYYTLKKVVKYSEIILFCDFYKVWKQIQKIISSDYFQVIRFLVSLNHLPYLH